MIYRVALRHLMLILISAFLLGALDARADLVSKNLNESVVAVNVYRDGYRDVYGKKDMFTVLGVVVQAGADTGYVVTHAALITNSDTLTVGLPETGIELTMQIIKTNASADLALLKVKGLNLRPLIFSLETSLPADSTQVIDHEALLGMSDIGSVVLNDCGELIGFNMSAGPGLEKAGKNAGDNAPNNPRLIEAASIAKFLAAQNIQVTRASVSCVSAVRSNEVAAQAKLDVAEAQRIAQVMELKLLTTDREKQQFAKQAGQARITAEAAIKVAAEAQAHAEQTRIDLEMQTATIMAETEAMVQLLQKDRDAAESRFNQVLERQRKSAVDREDHLIVGFVVLLALIILAVLLIQRGGIRPSALVKTAESEAKPAKGGASSTDMHKPALQEYVLDGRDEDGIRYLLRISGDQLSSDQGIVIGRNPNESPYIINHSDVSRQHARLKVMKNRVFIEDLGSTNGTSVNGQNIDDKGLVSVSNGDQIIIGSVVMKLRVMGI